MTTATQPQSPQPVPPQGQSYVDDNLQVDPNLPVSEVVKKLENPDLQNSPAEPEVPSVDVTKLLDEIVETALNVGASDIHIEPTEHKMQVRLRIDGILQKFWEFDKNIEQSLIFKVKIASKLRTDEHFAPQDGRVHFKFKNDRGVDTRVSILPITHGEKVVVRLLTQEGRSFSLIDLGVEGKELEYVQKAYNKPYGTILTVGPTGSGKTTTLYAILKLLNKPEVNITTIEDPVEYNIEGVNHIQINTKANLTFASGLRSILRQDPNIVMVGEIRDGETARIATNAAMTGHLVLSTLHTNDAITTIPRLIDMGIEPFLIASTVNLIIAQRLARKLCPNCRTPYIISQNDYNNLALMRPDMASLLKVGEQFFREQGCNLCHNGFKSRIGLYEILQVTESIRKNIMSNINIDQIYQQARREGLVLIVEDGIRKARAGVTSLSEVVRVTALKV